MSQKPTIVNRVAQSALVTIDLDTFFPKESFASIDLKDFLFRGMILKEIEFRQKVKEIDWSVYKDKVVNVFCSENSIIPMWAYMLISSKLSPFCSKHFYGSIEEVKEKYVLEQIQKISTSEYESKSVVIKGCGEEKVSPEIYMAVTDKLRPVVKSLMFGEPCSTVPIYKKPKNPS